MDLEQLKYPVGKIKYDGKPNESERNRLIEIIADFPDKLKQVVSKLSSEQLEWRYRPDGWNIRQVVHHCADSHLNAQLRFKLALTEDQPTIKPYLEHLWAELPDMQASIQVSLDLLTALHEKWAYLLRELTDEQLNRQYIHPEHQKTFDLHYTIAMYAWHCEHHFAHVMQAIEHQGQFD